MQNNVCQTVVEGTKNVYLDVAVDQSLSRDLDGQRSVMQHGGGFRLKKFLTTGGGGTATGTFNLHIAVYSNFYYF